MVKKDGFIQGMYDIHEMAVSVNMQGKIECRNIAPSTRDGFEILSVYALNTILSGELQNFLIIYIYFCRFAKPQKFLLFFDQLTIIYIYVVTMRLNGTCCVDSE